MNEKKTKRQNTNNTREMTPRTIARHDAKNNDEEKTMAENQEKPIKIVVEEKNPSGIKGLITLDENVVATIAGLAAKDVRGIHSVGKTRFLSFGDSPTRGVAAEVGHTQAAFDLDIVVDYGEDIRRIAKELREITASEVKKMAGRDVVEINIHVVDIFLPDTKPKQGSRVM